VHFLMHEIPISLGIYMFNYTMRMIMLCAFSASIFCQQDKETLRTLSPLTLFLHDIIKGSVGGGFEAPSGRFLGNWMFNILEKAKLKEEDKAKFVKRTPLQGLGGHLFCIIPTTAFQVAVDGMLKKYKVNDTLSALAAGALSTVVVSPSTNIVINQQTGESLFTTIKRMAGVVVSPSTNIVINQQTSESLFTTIKRMAGTAYGSFSKGYKPIAKQEAGFVWFYLKAKEEAEKLVKTHVTTHPAGVIPISAALCAVPGSALTQPFTNIGYWQQKGWSTSYLDTFEKMSEKGLWTCLREGWGPRMIRYWVALMILGTVPKVVDAQLKK